MLAALTLFFIYTLLTIPTAIVGVPWTLLTGDVSFVYGLAMRIARLGIRMAGIRIEDTWHAPLWLEPVDPSTRYIFLCNHISNLDPPILLPLLPGRASVFIKRSLLKIPLIGYGMRLANFIPVDRDGRVESAKESVAAAARAMAAGAHILSFVEGTRSKDGRLLPFKKGPFYLAMEVNMPVVPVSIWGTQTMMRKGSVKVYPGVAHVTFHAPLLPADFATREELMAAVRAAIASSLPLEQGLETSG
jgi:1-acyl-sn-glycerol-3-phosphate acyltransferase